MYFNEEERERKGERGSQYWCMQNKSYLIDFSGNTSRSRAQHGTQRNHYPSNGHSNRTGTNVRSARGGTTRSGSSRDLTGSAGGSSSYPLHGSRSSNWNDQDFGGQFPSTSGSNPHPFGSETSTGCGEWYMYLHYTVHTHH